MTAPSTIRKDFLYRLICILFGTIGFTAYALSKFVPGRQVVNLAAACGLGFIIALVLLALSIKNPSRVLRAYAVVWPTVLLGSYAILFVVVIFFQNKLANQTSAFFQPQPLSEANARALLSPQVEAVDLTTPDGTRLSGWMVNNSDSDASPLIIYFDGSGSEASRMVPFAHSSQAGRSCWSITAVSG